MSDGITGKASYECLSCGAVHYLYNEDFNFESESGSYREMGQETQYAAEFDEQCPKCNNDIEIKFEVWEYPVGIINMTDANITGAKIIDSDFGIFHEPPTDEYEKPVLII